MTRFHALANIFRTPWPVAAAAAVVLSVAAVWWGGLNQDEGWYLYAAQMVRSGSLPYHDFFFTQGPAMPFVYAALAPVWSPGSPLHGLLGGRVVTLLLGFCATFCAMGLVRRLVPAGRRGLAGFTVFALLACNLYHLYFTAIPKTYALGGLFVAAGFLLLVSGLDAGRRGFRHVALLLAAGLSLAFASGTRISLLLLLPAAWTTLLVCRRRYGLAFVWFGVGAAAGLFLTYGLFALDPVSMKSLLAAQGYHAARGGFDPLFAVGSVSRLVRGYAGLVALLFVAACGGRAAFAPAPPGAAADATDDRRPLFWMLGVGFAAVFLLQLSAPFPYDDYQVPLMGIAAVLVSAWFSRGGASAEGRAWMAFLVAGAMSFSSPQLQEWMTYGQDRFWSCRKETAELAKLRSAARRLNELDPGGRTLLTQDLYLAVESGRTVPHGLEMGPFSYFNETSAETARATHVLNRELMEALIASAPCTAAAVSGYGFAISAPSCAEVPRKEQDALRRAVAERYDEVERVERFGQNATPLVLYVRKKRGGAE